MSSRLRKIAEPFVVAAPGGARVRTRLMVDAADAATLRAVGAHLGCLAGADLAERCRQGVLDTKARAESRRERKRALTPGSSSRWAGAITRTSEDAWALARRNLEADTISLRARIRRIDQRVAVPVSERRGRVRGYANRNERWLKQQRLQVLRSRLGRVEAALAGGRVGVVRGGKMLQHKANNLDAAGTTHSQWRTEWEAERWFICADGEADKTLGNETIRWDPAGGSLEIRLPAPLAHLANRPNHRYRLSCPVVFPHRGDEVAAQTEEGSVRYDITFDAAKRRWYLDASWKIATPDVVGLDALRRHRVLAVDVNAGHLAAWVINPDGNPVGPPITVAVDLAGLSADTRDGHLRGVISTLIHTARASGCQAFVIEDLGFDQARAEGREHSGTRPSRGRGGRMFRRLVAGIPTAKFRDRLTQMAANAGLVVIAVDPAYTSQWGAQHWLGPLNQQFSSDVSGHHAAALTIGRRGLGQRARRRARCDSNPTEDGPERATDSAGRPTPTAPRQVGLFEPAKRKPGDRKTRGHPSSGGKTRQARGPSPGNQAAQDRSGPPTAQDSLLLSV